MLVMRWKKLRIEFERQIFCKAIVKYIEYAGIAMSCKQSVSALDDKPVWK